MTPDLLDFGPWARFPSPIPPEYADAVLSERLREIVQNTPSMTVLLIGPPGTGKTWNLYGVIQHYEARPHLGRPARLITEAKDIDGSRYDDALLTEWCRFPGVLCVDDVGYRSPTEWTRRAIYAIATERRAWSRPTVWATNLTLDRLAEQYTEAIRSRLAGGLVVPVKGEDRRIATA